MTSSTSLAEFCTMNNILWFPINLTIDGKTKTLESISHPLYNGRPKMTDFKELNIETIKKRQALLADPKWSQILNCIAMDTTQVKHIDIDTPEYDEGFDKMMETTPYFKSMTKSYGRHILIKFDDYEVESKRMQFQSKNIELLCGQWSYAPLEIFNADKEIIKLTNIQNLLVVAGTIKEKVTIIKKKEIINQPITVIGEAIDRPLTEIQILLDKCGNKCELHEDWISVAQILKNETKDEGLNDFVNWTNKFGSENKKKEAITYYTKYIKYTPKSDKKRLTIATLHFWVKQLEQFNTPTLLPSINENIISDYIFDVSDFNFAMLFNKLYKDKFVCVDKLKKEYYYFDDNKLLWLQDSGGTPIRNKISTDFCEYYKNYQNELMTQEAICDPNSNECEIIKKKIKKIAEICIKLNKTGDKNNILSEISDLCKDIEFPSTLNKSEYLLPTNDGKVLNIKDLSVHDRTINDKFSFQCGAKFIPFNEDDNFNKVDTYFNNLFCNNMETKNCVIDILKSVFIGRPLRYIYFCIGNGCNGKSLLFKILNKIFGRFMDIISESVIIEQKGNKSALNTEIEKLDKCRLGYVTELKETDKLNEKVIKQISGGDAINLRTLHTKDCTINPTCNTFVLTNEMASFNGEAKSNLDRMIIIPFKANFKINDGFEKEMLEMSDYIFSYIMHKGNVLDKFNLSEEMIEEGKKHAKNNTETTLEDYLKEYLIDCVNDKKDNKLIVLNDLRLKFEAYCVANKLNNSLTQKKFTSKMKTLGFVIKETNSKTMLYNKKYKDTELDENEE